MIRYLRLSDGVFGLRPADVRVALPETSFVDGTDLTEWGYAAYAEAPLPALAWNEEAVEVAPVDGVQQWVVQPRAVTVAEACARVDAERDRRLALDFAYDFGATVAIDDQGVEIAAGVRALQMAPANRADWQTIHGLALAAIISGSPTAVMPIRCEDNWNVQTTALEIVACLTAATLRGSALVFHGGALKTAIRAAGDPAAIDIMVGWPA